MKILVSQSRPEGLITPYDKLTELFGAEVDFQPFVRLEGLSATEFRTQHINPLDYTGVVLPSKTAADHYFRMMNELRLAVPETMHYYCISEAVGYYLQKYVEYRKRRIFFATGNNFMELVPTIMRRPKEKLLLVTSDQGNDAIVESFAAHKVTVTPVVMFHSVPESWPKQKNIDSYDIITFFTPGAVAAFWQLFPDYEQGKTLFAAFGTKTQDALNDADYRNDIVAPMPGTPSLATAIEQYLSNR